MLIVYRGKKKKKKEVIYSDKILHTIYYFQA